MLFRLILALLAEMLTYIIDIMTSIWELLIMDLRRFGAGELIRSATRFFLFGIMMTTDSTEDFGISAVNLILIGPEKLIISNFLICK